MGFTVILHITSSYFAVSQNLNNPAKPAPPNVSENDSFSFQLNSIKNSPVLYLNEVSSKAIRHFIRTYKNADSAKWSKLADGNGGFEVCFSTDGIPTRVKYDKAGNYVCCVREYFEDKLPKDIRHRVKSIYYDFVICYTKEVNMHDNTIYIITLEDKASWKNILVTEYTTEVLKEFSKTFQSNPGQ